MLGADDSIVMSHVRNLSLESQSGIESLKLHFEGEKYAGNPKSARSSRGTRRVIKKRKIECARGARVRFKTPVFHVPRGFC